MWSKDGMAYKIEGAVRFQTVLLDNAQGDVVVLRDQTMHDVIVAPRSTTGYWGIHLFRLFRRIGAWEMIS